jgi:hypothetical protein
MKLLFVSFMLLGWTKLGYIVCVCGNVTMNPPVQLLYTNKNFKETKWDCIMIRTYVIS